MVRWSSTTREQYVAAFRDGARKGRISWNYYLLKTVSLAMAITFGRLVLAMRYGELNAKTAPLYLAATALCSTIGVFCLTYRLARPTPEDPSPSTAALFLGVTAGIVLAFCLPKLL